MLTLADRFSAQVLDAMGQAVITTDLAGKVIAWNRAAEHLYGWSAAEAIGRNVVELTPTDQTRAEAAAIMALLSAGQRWEGELRVRRRDGSTFLAHVVDSPILDDDDQIVGVVGISHRVVERGLRSADEQLRLVLDSIDVGIWDWDLASGALTWSESLEPLHGFAPGAFDGSFEALVSAIHPEDAAGFAATVEQTLASGAELRTEFRVVWPDRSTHWISGRGRVFRDDAGKPVRMVGMGMDITDRKQAEDELAAALRSRDEFVSVAAHELRTPLTAIRGYAQAIQRQRARGTLDDERLTRHLEQVLGAAERLEEMTHDLLEVSRMRSGRLQVRPVAQDLAPIVRRAVDEQRGAFGDDNLLELYAPEDGCVAPVDGPRIAQVVANLVGNALKYSTGHAAVRVTLAAEREGYRVSVADSGIGLPPGAESAIFEPFGRAANAGERPGMGLGLSICRSIVDLHGGRIWAESEGEGQGTTVTFWLPAA